jgi:hypothetical protein
MSYIWLQSMHLPSLAQLFSSKASPTPASWLPFERHNRVNPFASVIAHGRSS